MRFVVWIVLIGIAGGLTGYLITRFERNAPEIRTRTTVEWIGERYRHEVGISDEKQFRDIRRTGYQERVTAGASLGGLAASAAHSYVTAAKMAEVYGPQTLEMAKGAQDQRAAYLKERRRGRGNKKGPKV